MVMYMYDNEEAMEQFSETINNVIQQVTDALQSVIESLTKAIHEILKQIQPVLEFIWVGFVKFCKTYENRRVVHLAVYAKKHRVRQKNRNRLLNDYLKTVTA